MSKVNKEAYKREQAAAHLQVQQANQIALQNIKIANERQQDEATKTSAPATTITPTRKTNAIGTTVVRPAGVITRTFANMENNESEHLLCGQDEAQQQLLLQSKCVQQQQKQPEQSARVNFKEHAGGNIGQTAGNYLHYNVVDADDDDVDDDDDDDDDDAAAALAVERQYQPINEMTQHGNADGLRTTGVPTIKTISSAIAPTGLTTMTIATTTPTPTTENSKLDMQKFSADMMQNKGNNLWFGNSGSGAGNDQNSATVGFSPTPTAAAATHVVEGGSGQNDANANGNEYKGPKIWRHLVRKWNGLSELFALLVIFLALWCIGYVLMPDYAMPHTVIMRIAFLFVGAKLAGILVTFAYLPDMLGMLFFGVLYTNCGLADFSGYGRFEAFLRELALINIMLLAGLGLDGKAFKQLWLMIMGLTLIPTIAEVAAIAVLAWLTLNMPWLWGILLGLVITAVSPNVVVTVMLKLKEERLGLNSGIHTLIYAMTTCNDVVAIFLFGVIVGVIYSTGTLTDQILQGPIGIGIGVVFGYIYGVMLSYLPSKNSSYVNGLRFVLTILGGIIAVMGSKAIGYPSAGALGCVVIAFVAGLGWKKQVLNMTIEQKQAYEMSSVPKRLDLLWKFLKPVSFSLIGKEINFGVLEGKVVGYGALLVLVGSLFRLAFAYISTYGGNLTRKERAYITISGFPKATVQAALGPIALDMARSLNANDAYMALARNVLIISVLAIIFTAPLGAILMLRLAPVLLKRRDDTENDDDL